MLHDPSRGLKGLTRAVLALGVVSLSSLALYAFYLNVHPTSRFHTTACEAQSFAPSESDIAVPGAPYIPASSLLARSSPAPLDEETASWNGTIPKIIHQSWKEDKLPSKFLSWSNSWRIRHPDWQWVRGQDGGSLDARTLPCCVLLAGLTNVISASVQVLWTDEDNNALVAKHWPMLNDTYWAMKGNIYRADLARNLYMYTYGG